MLKLLVCDTFAEAALQELQSLPNLKVIYLPTLNSASLPSQIGQYLPNILLVRPQTKVTAEVVDACPTLSCVVSLGTDLSHIDKTYCSQRGVIVTASGNEQTASAVAELTLGLIIAVNRRILDGVQIMKDGWWAKDFFSNCQGLAGQTIGLVGYGPVSQKVAKAAKALQMNVLVHTRAEQPP
jgi:D-3-phosphoglycerate dehydrogenase / 2-oxoglutarate reductase